jgi:hypothetical protein
VSDSATDFSNHLHTKCFGFQFSILHLLHAVVNTFQGETIAKFNCDLVRFSVGPTFSVFSCNLKSWVYTRISWPWPRCRREFA